jgi:tetratricopeptide (TPR) repeat protein
MKINRTQWIVIGSCIVLLLGIYLFADTKKIETEKPAGPMAARDAQKPAAQDFDWDGYLKKVKANITNSDTLNLISGWEKDQTEANLKSLIDLYHKRGESVSEAYYTLELAKIKKDGKLSVRAGDLFGATAGISNDEALHQFLSDKAVESFKASMVLDSTTENRLKLATAYMDQGTAPMQGVGILLDVVAKDSTNADAQMLLGKFGLVSHQYDKAIVRLEKVVSLRPKNYDALFLLAEAYRGKGDKEKAIQILEKCSKMVDKPELKKEIEQYIKNIKAKS